MVKAILREVIDSDLGMILDWRNAEAVRKNMYTNHLISVEEHRNWWERERVNERTRVLICQLDLIDVGVVTFTNYSGVGGVASWAFYSSGQRGVGAAMERAAMDYAFDILEVRKLECEVLDFNSAVIKFHLKHGFCEEGVFRDAYLREGKLYDIHRLAIRAEDWTKIVRPALDKRANSESTQEDYSGRRFEKKLVIDSASVDLFSKAVGDFNPVHLDDNAANSMGFAKRISHGMLVGSLFSGFFASEFPGPGTIYVKQDLSFHSPIFVGQAVELKLFVLNHLGRKLVVETQVFDEGTLCVSGQATLLTPKKS